MPEILLFCALSAAAIYGSITLFMLVGFLKIKNQTTSNKVKISIIVAARNEEKLLPKCLQAAANQTYPDKEIVVINDRSKDSTGKIIEDFQKNYPFIKKVDILNATTKVSPKKFALEQGIKKSTGDIIFVTDADCVPNRDWIKNMLPLFSEDVGLVAGFAPFFDANNLLNKILRLDNFSAAFAAAGAIGWQTGVTCTGRNLAYRREVYDELDGFSAINHSLSGDDDLFLQLVATKTKWKLAYSQDKTTAVYSHSVQTFKDFVRQRRRHVSAARYYSWQSKIGYFLFNISNLCIFSFFIFSIISNLYLKLALILLSSKIAFDFAALFCVASNLRQTHLLAFIPFWQVFNLINQTIISPLGFIGKVKWK